MTKEIEIVNPSHYTYAEGLEPWDVIEAWGLGFNLGNVLKYVARHRHKGTPIADLRKARVYLEREIALRSGPLGRLRNALRLVVETLLRSHPDAPTPPRAADVALAWDLLGGEREDGWMGDGDFFLDLVRLPGISSLQSAVEVLDRWIVDLEEATP